MAYITTDYMPLKMPIPGSREPAQISLLNENAQVLAGHTHATGGGLPVAVLRAGPAAGRPTPAEAGAFYFSVDAGLASLSTGTTWVDFVTSGSAGTTLIDPTVRDAILFGPEGSGVTDTTLQRVGAGGLQLNSSPVMTQALADARYKPIGYAPPDTDLTNYYTKPESDARFVNVTGDTVTGSLNVSGALSRAGQPVLTKADGDALYAPIGTGGGITQAEGDARYLQLTGGAVTGALTVVGKNVGASAAGGNTLVWNADGFYVPTPAGGGGLATDPLADAKGDLFAASAADAVGRLAVGANGQVLTADSAQPLGVKWAAVSGGGGLDQATADTLYVNVGGDAMTGALTLQNATASANVLRTKRTADAAQRFRIDTDGRLEWTNSGTGTVSAALEVVSTAFQVTGSLTPTGSSNLGTTSNRWQSVSAVILDVSSQLVGSSDATFLRLGATNPAASGSVRLRNAAAVAWRNAGNSADLPLTVDASDRLAYSGSTLQLGGDANLARLAAGQFRASGAANSVVDVRSTGATASARMGQVVASGARNDITVNCWFDGTNWVRDDTSKSAVAISLRDDTAFVMTYAPAGANPIAWPATPSLTWGGNGSLTINPNSGASAVIWAGGDGYLDKNGNNARIVCGANRLELYGGLGVIPSVDQLLGFGDGTHRWAALYAMNGTIQTSHVSMKENFQPLDPSACARAVLDTAWWSFDYRNPERAAEMAEETYDQLVAESAPTRHQNGYVLGSADHPTSDLFGLGDRRSANAGSDLAVVACALQQALRDIAELKERLDAAAA